MCLKNFPLHILPFKCAGAVIGNLGICCLYIYCDRCGVIKQRRTVWKRLPLKVLFNRALSYQFFLWSSLELLSLIVTEFRFFRYTINFQRLTVRLTSQIVLFAFFSVISIGILDEKSGSNDVFSTAIPIGLNMDYFK